MYAKNLALLLVVLFLIVSCSSTVPLPEPTETRFARPLATTLSVPLLDPTPEATETGIPALTKSPSGTVLPTALPTLLPTATATPTVPPPLALRDDLPPLTLKDWPRPANDNGLGIHFVATGYYDAAELDRQIARIQDLHLKWALVLYADENHLQLAAEKFKAARIAVVWRKTLRPYQRYFGWGRDIEILQQVGMPPYMQLYNEPELPAEWDNQPIDSSQFMGNLLQAAKDVYNAGGFPGIQFLDDNSLREFIDQIYMRKGEALFHRMFFVAHPYGLNHPPGYVEDANGVLGFTIFAQILQRRLGFIPPVIAGEGGWKIESHEDTRFPAIDDSLHREYTMAVFNWFKSGVMSNDKPLPDYLFAFCHWMLSGGQEAGAWYDSFKGDRTLTIQAAQQFPIFVRKFTWDKPAH